eukprot:6254384-Amphidinium_carterae.1
MKVESDNDESPPAEWSKGKMKRCDDALRSFMGVQHHTRRPQVNVPGRCGRVCDALRCNDSTVVVFAKLANGAQPVTNEFKVDEEKLLPWEE